MRTDVKVGLICLFAIVLGVVIYFVAQGNAHPRDAKADAGAITTGGSATPKAPSADKSPAAPVVAPPVATPSVVIDPRPAAADGTIADKTGSPTLLAQGSTPPSGSPMGGGIIPAPAAPIVTPPLGASPTSPASPAAAPVTPPLYGGVPGNSGMGGTSTMPAGTPSFGGMGSSPMSPSPGYTRPDVPTPGNFGTGAPGTGAPGMGGNRSGRSYGGGAGGIGGAMGGGGMGGYAVPSDSPTSGRTSDAMNSGNSSRNGSTYKIEKGDMLGTIAKKTGVSVAAIEKANPGIDSNHLKINAVINIPAATASPATPPRTTVAVDKPTATRPSSKGGDSSKTAKATTGSGKITPGSTYTVKKGDTLGNIAEAAYGDRKAWQRIFRANRGEIDDANTITVGTVLRIPI